MSHEQKRAMFGGLLLTELIAVVVSFLVLSFTHSELAFIAFAVAAGSFMLTSRIAKPYANPE